MISSVMLWTLKGSLEDRLEAAAHAGFQSVEFVGEYANWTDARIAEVKKLCRSLGLGMSFLGKLSRVEMRKQALVLHE